MPNPIPPNLDPTRFQYMNPLVFGEFNAAGNIGWNTATGNILNYYLSQSPFDTVLIDTAMLGEDIVAAFKVNLEQDLVENSAEDLGALILQALVEITRQPVEGIDPPSPIEDELPLPDLTPGDVTPAEPPTREVFPPLVVPREPSPDTGRDESPESNQEGEQPEQREQPDTGETRRPQPIIDIGEPPLFQQPILPIPRETNETKPEVEIPQNGEGLEEESPEREPVIEDDSGNGDTREDEQPEGITIDYSALEEAIFNALKRFYSLMLTNPATVTVQSETPETPSSKEQGEAIVDQFNLYNNVANGMVKSLRPINPEEIRSIFTIPGGK